MLIEYKNEVKSVFVNKRAIGFIARRFTIFNFNNQSPNDWVATKTLLSPEWQGGFETRESARFWLIEQMNKE